MKSKTLHFKSYEPAINYHISQRLTKQGWQMMATPEFASLTDANLTLDDRISILLEYKHLNALLIQRFCPNIAPLTFAINDYNYENVLETIYYHKYANEPWILKPSLMNNGDNILLFDNVKELMDHYVQPNRLLGDHVIQKYVQHPDLWDGKKYTFRVPCVLTNYGGVFLHKHGYCNISALPYDPDFEAEGSERRVHITNYILDGRLAGIQQISTHDYPDFDRLYPKLCKIVSELIKAVVAVFPRYLQPKDKKAFEIFGFDFILDKNKKPLLLEVNQGPDFPMIQDHPLDKTLWEPFWASIIQEFVEPVALEAPNPSTSAFTQVLEAHQVTHPGYFARAKGKKFLKRFMAEIRIKG